MIVPENGHGFPEIPRDQNEDSRQGSGYDTLYAKARKQGVPLKGTFELTPLCNLRCKMCYVQLTPEQMGGRMPLSPEQWKDLMHQAWEAGMIEATLTGGECLTYPGFKDVYLYLQSLGCEIIVLSNGVLLNESWVRFFQEHMPAMIQITLYGCDEDMYERVTGHRVCGTVLDNIRRIQDAGLPFKLTVTPNHYLGEGVFDTIRMAKQFGHGVVVNSFGLVPRAETGRSDQDNELGIEFYARIYRFINQLEGVEIKELPENALPPVGGQGHESCENGLPCAGGRIAFTIDWKGTMHPCQSLDMIEGHPLDEGFRLAWRRINQAACGWPQVPECVGCAYQPVCTNCAAKMLRFAEPGKQPIALCKQTRYLVMHGAKRFPGSE